MPLLLPDLPVPPGQRQQLQKRRDNKPTPPLLLFRILLMLLVLVLLLVWVLLVWVLLAIMVSDCLPLCMAVVMLIACCV
jgi:hypothetical protein